MFRGLLLWLLIMALEAVHAILRDAFLMPWFGEAMTKRTGIVVATIIVLLVTWLLIGWTGLRERAALLKLGALWAVLTFLFEIGIGLLRGFDAQRLWAEIDPFQRGPMLLTLAIMFIAPLAAARFTKVPASEADGDVL